MSAAARRTAGVLTTVVVAAAAPLAVAGATSNAAAAAGTVTCQPASDSVSAAVPWAQRQLDPSQVWPLAQGAHVTVAVIDTGVSAAAPALAGRVLPGADVTVATKNAHANTDCTGHGTFAAGIVAAAAQPGSGFSGMAPQARILPVRVVSAGATGAEDVTPDSLAHAIDAAVAGGASVIDTVATAPYSSAALATSVSTAIRRGVVIVAPSSTTRDDQGDVAEPAALPGVVSVAGVDASGAPLARTTPAHEPTVCAPAGNLTSVPPSGSGTISGSQGSFGSAYVAGTVALMRSYAPDLTPAQITQRLVATAVPGADPSIVGHGIVDPAAAVTNALPAANARVARTPSAPAVALGPRPHPSSHAMSTAVVGSAVAVGSAVLVLLVGAVIVQGRRRSWRVPAQ